MLTKIFTMLLEDYLNETSYDAKMACLSFSVLATTTGFLISFYGCAPSSPWLQHTEPHNIHKQGLNGKQADMPALLLLSNYVRLLLQMECA